MPKIIHGLKESILREARNMVMETGYSEFSIRSLATRCGIATGTLYNYFDTKDTILATVMIEDWKVFVSQIESDLDGAKSMSDGAMAIYYRLHEFFLMYEKVFKGYVGAASELGLHGERHGKFRNLMDKWLMALMEKTGTGNNCSVTIASEVIIALSTKGVYNDNDVRMFFEKMFS